MFSVQLPEQPSAQLRRCSRARLLCLGHCLLFRAWGSLPYAAILRDEARKEFERLSQLGAQETRWMFRRLACGLWKPSWSRQGGREQLQVRQTEVLSAAHHNGRVLSLTDYVLLYCSAGSNKSRCHGSSFPV